MLDKPGLLRAIPMGIFGFLLGAALVLVVRALQNMDPLWDAGVALSIAPLTTTFFFLWGMGAFNPKMSEHGDHGHEDAHGETALLVVDEHAHVHPEEAEIEPEVSLESNPFSRAMSWVISKIWTGIPRPNLTQPPNHPGFFLISWPIHLLWFVWGVIVRVIVIALIAPFALLGGVVDGIVWLFSFTNVYAGGIWRVFTWTLVVIAIIFAFAMLPTGLRLDTTTDPAASRVDVGYDTIELFGTEVAVSQLTVFAGFVFFTMLSLALVAGLLALVFYGANRSIVEVRETESEGAPVPPEPVQDVGQVSGWFARVLRGIPWLLGYRN